MQILCCLCRIYAKFMQCMSNLCRLFAKYAKIWTICKKYAYYAKQNMQIYANICKKNRITRSASMQKKYAKNIHNMQNTQKYAQYAKKKKCKK